MWSHLANLRRRALTTFIRRRLTAQPVKHERLDVHVIVREPNEVRPGALEEPRQLGCYLRFRTSPLRGGLRLRRVA